MLLNFDYNYNTHFSSWVGNCNKYLSDTPFLAIVYWHVRFWTLNYGSSCWEVIIRYWTLIIKDNSKVVHIHDIKNEVWGVIFCLSISGKNYSRTWNESECNATICDDHAIFISLPNRIKLTVRAFLLQKMSLPSFLIIPTVSWQIPK